MGAAQSSPSTAPSLRLAFPSPTYQAAQIAYHQLQLEAIIPEFQDFRAAPNNNHADEASSPSEVEINIPLSWTALNRILIANNGFSTYAKHHNDEHVRAFSNIVVEGLRSKFILFTQTNPNSSNNKESGITTFSVQKVHKKDSKPKDLMITPVAVIISDSNSGKFRKCYPLASIQSLRPLPSDTVSFELILDSKVAKQLKLRDATITLKAETADSRNRIIKSIEDVMSTCKLLSNWMEPSVSSVPSSSPSSSSAVASGPSSPVVGKSDVSIAELSTRPLHREWKETDRFDLLLERSQLLIQQGDYAPAIVDLDLICEARGNHKQAYGLRAQAYIGLARQMMVASNSDNDNAVSPTPITMRNWNNLRIRSQGIDKGGKVQSAEDVEDDTPLEVELPSEQEQQEQQRQSKGNGFSLEADLCFLYGCRGWADAVKHSNLAGKKAASECFRLLDELFESYRSHFPMRQSAAAAASSVSSSIGSSIISHAASSSGLFIPSAIQQSPEFLMHFYFEARLKKESAVKNGKMKQITPDYISRLPQRAEEIRDLHSLASQSFTSLQNIGLEVFSSLEVLHLSHNRLRSVQSNVLKALPNLRELYLRNNVITYFDAPLENPNLMLVDLSGNNISSLEVISAGLSKVAATLRTLSLIGNPCITELLKSGSHHLVTLKYRYPLITTTFPNLQQLDGFYISDAEKFDARMRVLRFDGFAHTHAHARDPQTVLTLNSFSMIDNAWLLALSPDASIAHRGLSALSMFSSDFSRRKALFLFNVCRTAVRTLACSVDRSLVLDAATTLLNILGPENVSLPVSRHALHYFCMHGGVHAIVHLLRVLLSVLNPEQAAEQQSSHSHRSSSSNALASPYLPSKSDPRLSNFRAASAPEQQQNQVLLYVLTNLLHLLVVGKQQEKRDSSSELSSEESSPQSPTAFMFSDRSQIHGALRSAPSSASTLLELINAPTSSVEPSSSPSASLLSNVIKMRALGIISFLHASAGDESAQESDRLLFNSLEGAAVVLQFARAPLADVHPLPLALLTLMRLPFECQASRAALGSPESLTFLLQKFNAAAFEDVFTRQLILTSILFALRKSAGSVTNFMEAPTEIYLEALLSSLCSRSSSLRELSYLIIAELCTQSENISIIAHNLSSAHIASLISFNHNAPSAASSIQSFIQQWPFSRLHLQHLVVDNDSAFNFLLLSEAEQTAVQSTMEQLSLLAIHRLSFSSSSSISLHGSVSALPIFRELLRLASNSTSAMTTQRALSSLIDLLTLETSLYQQAYHDNGEDDSAIPQVEQMLLLTLDLLVNGTAFVDSLLEWIITSAPDISVASSRALHCYVENIRILIDIATAQEAEDGIALPRSILTQFLNFTASASSQLHESAADAENEPSSVSKHLLHQFASVAIVPKLLQQIATDLLSSNESEVTRRIDCLSSFLIACTLDDALMQNAFQSSSDGNAVLQWLEYSVSSLAAASSSSSHLILQISLLVLQHFIAISSVSVSFNLSSLIHSLLSWFHLISKSDQQRSSNRSAALQLESSSSSSHSICLYPSVSSIFFSSFAPSEEEQSSTLELEFVLASVLNRIFTLDDPERQEQESDQQQQDDDDDECDSSVQPVANANVLHQLISQCRAGVIAQTDGLSALASSVMGSHSSLTSRVISLLCFRQQETVQFFAGSLTRQELVHFLNQTSSSGNGAFLPITTRILLIQSFCHLCSSSSASAAVASSASTPAPSFEELSPMTGFRSLKKESLPISLKSLPAAALADLFETISQPTPLTEQLITSFIALLSIKSNLENIEFLQNNHLGPLFSSLALSISSVQYSCSSLALQLASILLDPASYSHSLRRRGASVSKSSALKQFYASSSSASSASTPRPPAASMSSLPVTSKLFQSVRRAQDAVSNAGILHAITQQLHLIVSCLTSSPEDTSDFLSATYIESLIRVMLSTIQSNHEHNVETLIASDSITLLVDLMLRRSAFGFTHLENFASLSELFNSTLVCLDILSRGHHGPEKVVECATVGSLCSMLSSAWNLIVSGLQDGSNASTLILADFSVQILHLLLQLLQSAGVFRNQFTEVNGISFLLQIASSASVASISAANGNLFVMKKVAVIREQAAQLLGCIASDSTCNEWLLKEETIGAILSTILSSVTFIQLQKNLLETLCSLAQTSPETCLVIARSASIPQLVHLIARAVKSVALRVSALFEIVLRTLQKQDESVLLDSLVSSVLSNDLLVHLMSLICRHSLPISNGFSTNVLQETDQDAQEVQDEDEAVSSLNRDSSMDLGSFVVEDDDDNKNINSVNGIGEEGYVASSSLEDGTIPFRVIFALSRFVVGQDSLVTCLKSAIDSSSSSSSSSSDESFAQKLSISSVEITRECLLSLEPSTDFSVAAMSSFVSRILRLFLSVIPTATSSSTKKFSNVILMRSVVHALGSILQIDACRRIFLTTLKGYPVVRESIAVLLDQCSNSPSSASSPALKKNRSMDNISVAAGDEGNNSVNNGKPILVDFGTILEILLECLLSIVQHDSPTAKEFVVSKPFSLLSKSTALFPSTKAAALALVSFTLENSRDWHSEPVEQFTWFFELFSSSDDAASSAGLSFSHSVHSFSSALSSKLHDESVINDSQYKVIRQLSRALPFHPLILKYLGFSTLTACMTQSSPSLKFNSCKTIENLLKLPTTPAARISVCHQLLNDNDFGSESGLLEALCKLLAVDQSSLLHASAITVLHSLSESRLVISEMAQCNLFREYARLAHYYANKSPPFANDAEAAVASLGRSFSSLYSCASHLLHHHQQNQENQDSLSFSSVTAADIAQQQDEDASAAAVSSPSPLLTRTASSLSVAVVALANTFIVDANFVSDLCVLLSKCGESSPVVELCRLARLLLQYSIPNRQLFITAHGIRALLTLLSRTQQPEVIAETLRTLHIFLDDIPLISSLSPDKFEPLFSLVEAWLSDFKSSFSLSEQVLREVAVDLVCSSIRALPISQFFTRRSTPKILMDALSKFHSKGDILDRGLAQRCLLVFSSFYESAPALLSSAIMSQVDCSCWINMCKLDSFCDQDISIAASELLYLYAKSHVEHCRRIAASPLFDVFTKSVSSSITAVQVFVLRCMAAIVHQLETIPRESHLVVIHMITKASDPVVLVESLQFLRECVVIPEAPLESVVAVTNSLFSFFENPEFAVFISSGPHHLNTPPAPSSAAASVASPVNRLLLHVSSPGSSASASSPRSPSATSDSYATPRATPRPISDIHLSSESKRSVLLSVVRVLDSVCSVPACATQLLSEPYGSKLWTIIEKLLRSNNSDLVTATLSLVRTVSSVLCVRPSMDTNHMTSFIRQSQISAIISQLGADVSETVAQNDISIFSSLIHFSTHSELRHHMLQSMIVEKSIEVLQRCTRPLVLDRCLDVLLLICCRFENGANTILEWEGYRAIANLLASPTYPFSTYSRALAILYTIVDSSEQENGDSSNSSSSSNNKKTKQDEEDADEFLASALRSNAYAFNSIASTPPPSIISSVDASSILQDESKQLSRSLRKFLSARVRDALNFSSSSSSSSSAAAPSISPTIQTATQTANCIVLSLDMLAATLKYHHITSAAVLKKYLSPLEVIFTDSSCCYPPSPAGLFGGSDVAVLISACRVFALAIESAPSSVSVESTSSAVFSALVSIFVNHLMASSHMDSSSSSSATSSSSALVSSLQQHLLLALYVLIRSSRAHQQSFILHGGVEAVVPYLQSPELPLQVAATQVLTIITKDTELSSRMRKEDIIPVMLGVFRNRSKIGAQIRASSLECLLNIVKADPTPAAAELVLLHQGLPSILKEAQGAHHMDQPLQQQQQQEAHDDDEYSADNFNHRKMQASCLALLGQLSRQKDCLAVLRSERALKGLAEQLKLIVQRIHSGQFGSSLGSNQKVPSLDVDDDANAATAVVVSEVHNNNSKDSSNIVPQQHSAIEVEIAQLVLEQIAMLCVSLEDQEMLRSLDGVDLLVSILRQYQVRDPFSLVAPSLRALAAAVVRNDRCQTLLENLRGIPLVLQFLDYVSNSGNTESALNVKRQACAVIDALSYSFDIRPFLMVESRLRQLLVLIESPDLPLSQSALSAITNLCGDNRAPIAIMSSDFLSKIVSLLKMNDEKLVSTACRVLRNASEVEERCSVLLEMETVANIALMLSRGYGSSEDIISDVSIIFSRLWTLRTLLLKRFKDCNGLQSLTRLLVSTRQVSTLHRILPLFAEMAAMPEMSTELFLAGSVPALTACLNCQDDSIDRLVVPTLARLLQENIPKSDSYRTLSEEAPAPKPSASAPAPAPSSVSPTIVVDSKLVLIAFEGYVAAGGPEQISRVLGEMKSDHVSADCLTLISLALDTSQYASYLSPQAAQSTRTQTLDSLRTQGGLQGLLRMSHASNEETRRLALSLIRHSCHRSLENKQALRDLHALDLLSVYLSDDHERSLQEEALMSILEVGIADDAGTATKLVSDFISSLLGKSSPDHSSRKDMEKLRLLEKERDELESQVKEQTFMKNELQKKMEQMQSEGGESSKTITKLQVQLEEEKKRGSMLHKLAQDSEERERKAQEKIEKFKDLLTELNERTREFSQQTTQRSEALLKENAELKKKQKELEAEMAPLKAFQDKVRKDYPSPEQIFGYMRSLSELLENKK